MRTVIVYAATQSSSYYLGDSDLDTMSSEIVDAHGLAGSNVEYVVNLAEYCRNYIPEDNDPHLFGLERRVKELLNMRLLKSVETRTDDEETYLDSDLYDYDKDKNDTDSSSSFESDEGAEEHSLPDSE